jgi:hypothetical protein
MTACRMLLAGCLTAQAASDNPNMPADMRAEGHAVYDESFALLNAALGTPARYEPIAQPLPATPLPQPRAPDSLSSAPLPETPLREPPTATVRQLSPVFEEPQSPLQQPTLQPIFQPTSLPTPVTALPSAPIRPPTEPPLPASGSTPAAGSTRSPAPPPPPSPPILATGQPVPGLRGPSSSSSSSSITSTTPLLCVLRHAVLTLTFYFVLFTSLASRPTVTCTLVSVIPSTRSALLSSARATFFVVASGPTVRKRERPPRPRDKKRRGASDYYDGVLSCAARSDDNRF